jgi:hypothetical protein
MDGEGYDFFSRESTADNTWADTASGHGSSAPLRVGEELDLNSQAADGSPHLAEYGAFLQYLMMDGLGLTDSSHDF